MFDVSRRRALGMTVAAAASLTRRASAQVVVGNEVPFEPVPSWYERQPLRISWHLMRDIDGRQSGADLVQSAVAAGVNAVCFTVDGSRAFYPSQVPFHQRSSALPEGRDFVGEFCEAAESAGVRPFARFDFSDQPEETFQAHPEWFHKRSDGSFVKSDGRYRPCLNGNFYRRHALEVVNEVIARYRPAFIFFNNFSNVSNTGEKKPCLRGVHGRLGQALFRHGAAREFHSGEH